MARILSTIPGDEASALAERLLTLPDNAEVLLDRRGQTVFRFQHHKRDLVAKRYTLQGFTKRLTSALGASRAVRSVRSAQRLIKAGINTPEPILATLAGGLLPHTAFLVTTFQPGLQLPEFLRQHPGDHPDLIEKIVQLVVHFQSASCSHGDFHAKNILVDDNKDIIIIDLDGVRSHPLPSRLRKRYQRDRKRMIGSLQEFPDFAQQLDDALPPA